MNAAQDGQRPLTLAALLAAIQTLQDQVYDLRFPDGQTSGQPLTDALRVGPAATSVAIQYGLEALQQQLQALQHLIQAHAGGVLRLDAGPDLWERARWRHAHAAEPAPPLG
jgi:hypothetical protein